MAYEFPVDPQVVLRDRAAQIANAGIAAADVAGVVARISDMWADAPGGWVHEWSQLARAYADGDDHLKSSIAYGMAKFPVLASEPRKTAYKCQVEEYLAAAPGFGVGMERCLLDVGYRGGRTQVVAHLLSPRPRPAGTPVVMASGGIDTWKMDLHGLLSALATLTGFPVLAFDHPGSGETAAPLDGDADEVVLGIAAEARAMGNGRVGHFGLSFGGNFSAMTGLTGAVDAAVVLGGPLDATFDARLVDPGYSGYMRDVLANACGFDTSPSMAELLQALQALRRGPLLAGATGTPMLVVNGADDPLVPRADTLAFEGRQGAEVHLIEGAGHCAPSKLRQVVPMVAGWLRRTLAG